MTGSSDCLLNPLLLLEAELPDDDGDGDCTMAANLQFTIKKEQGSGGTQRQRQENKLSLTSPSQGDALWKSRGRHLLIAAKRHPTFLATRSGVIFNFHNWQRPPVHCTEPPKLRLQQRRSTAASSPLLRREGRRLTVAESYLDA